MAFNDGVKVGPIAYIGAVSVLVTFALVLLLQVLYYQQNNSLREADFAAQGPPRELTELTAKQQTALMKRGYVDRERDVVSIGIKRAKELVVTELGERKSPQDVIGPRPPDLGPLKKAAPADEDSATSKEPVDAEGVQSEGSDDSPDADGEEEAAKAEPDAKQEPPDDGKR